MDHFRRRRILKAGEAFFPSDSAGISRFLPGFSGFCPSSGPFFGVFWVFFRIYRFFAGVSGILQQFPAFCQLFAGVSVILQQFSALFASISCLTPLCSRFFSKVFFSPHSAAISDSLPGVFIVAIARFSPGSGREDVHIFVASSLVEWSFPY